MRRTVIRYAENHRGLVARCQLLRAGDGPSRIRNRQRSGRLRMVRPGVYAVPGSPRSWEQGLQAILLPVPESAASHVCSLRSLGLKVPAVP